MAGVRIGAVVSTSDIIDVLKNAVVNDLGVNIIAQYGAIAGLKSKSEWEDKIKSITFNNQKLIKEVVDEIDGVFLPVYPSEANMMAIDLSGAGISPKRKIFTREGEYTSNLFGDNYLRISYSIPEEQIKVFCEEFPKAVEALRK